MEQKMSYMGNLLAPEILLNIFSFLKGRELDTTAMVCKKYNELITTTTTLFNNKSLNSRLCRFPLRCLSERNDKHLKNSNKLKTFVSELIHVVQNINFVQYSYDRLPKNLIFIKLLTEDKTKLISKLTPKGLALCYLVEKRQLEKLDKGMIECLNKMIQCLILNMNIAEKKNSREIIDQLHYSSVQNDKDNEIYLVCASFLLANEITPDYNNFYEKENLLSKFLYALPGIR